MEYLPTAIDHVVLLCSDMDTAESAFKSLGFRTTPRGFHRSGLGTSNSTVVLPDRRSYIELLGIVEPTDRNRARHARLQHHGSHIFGVAFKGNALEASKTFQKLRVLDELVGHFSRDVELHGVTAKAEFSVARSLPDAFPGAWLFVCEHHTPELVWRDDAMNHPIGAHSLLGMIGISQDLIQLSQSWSPLFPSLQLDRMARTLTVSLNRGRLAFLDPAAFAARFRYSAAVDATFDTSLTTLHVAVRDKKAAERYLTDRSIEHWRVDQADLFIPDNLGLGASLLLSQSP